MNNKEKVCKVNEKKIIEKNEKNEKNEKKNYSKLSVLLNYFIKLFSKWDLKLNKNEKIENELAIEDLTANLSRDDEKEFIKPYLGSLKYSISNDNVTNIALTGGFGTGKSTIINEFIKQNKGYEYLQISLANFKDNENDEKLIETSILQQIIYFERKDKIKESSFSRINFTNNKLKLTYSLLILLWIYSIVFLFFETINSKICFFGNVIEYFKYFFQIFFVFGVVVMIFKTFDKLKNFKLSKLSPNDFEVINDKNENQLSVFNRNIEEIIYFFEKTDTSIVIIEDIDRFGKNVAIQLFSKIRELSILIKQSKDVKQKVSFIYAVKDELLLKEKTKFFDIIIPVIPITDYNNSKNIFNSKLFSFFKNEKLSEQIVNDETYLNQTFISEVSNYVFDMRTLINICNEFKIYDNALKNNKSSLNKNKLFGIILYKNLFPEDFAKIQIGNSNLHLIFKKEISDESLFHKKTTSLQSTKIENETKKKKLEDDIDDNILKDVTELRKIYLFELLIELRAKNEQIHKIEGININGDLTKNENFNLIVKSDNIKYQKESYSSVSSSSYISFNDIEKKINHDLKYNQREQLINDFHNKKVNKIQGEINDLTDQINYIKNASITNLYKEFENETQDLIDLTFTTLQIDEETKKQTRTISPNIKIIHYLIKNDYINEDFVNYVSYFHEGSLSRNDHDLLMKIIENKPTEFDSKIDNIEKLVNEINSIRFSNKSALIYEIFRFLLNNRQNSHLRNPRLDLLLNQIINNNDGSIFFLEKFIKTLKNNSVENIKILNNFYVEITNTWDGFWLVVNYDFSNEILKREILFDLFQLFSDTGRNQIIKALNKNKSITDYINSDNDFLKDIFEKINIDDFISTLKILDFNLKELTYDSKLDDLLLEIYKNDLYEINLSNSMIFARIDTKYDFNEKLFLESNYSFLSTKEDTFLFKRINKNLNDYIENVYLKIEDNINENANTIQSLLEKESSILSNKNKIAIIEKGFIDKINSVNYLKRENDYEVAEKLFKTNKIIPSWQTIIELTDWEDFNFDVIVDFINENYNVLSINDLYENQSDYFDEEKKFYDFTYKLINCEKLKRESFKSIFENSMDLKLTISEIKIGLNFILSNGKINSLKELRIQHLIEKNYIELNQKEFNYLNENDKKILIKLIEKNEIKFIEDISTYDFEIDLLQYLLYSSISELNKIKIISEKEDLIIDEDNVESEIYEKIINIFISEKFINYSSELFDKLLLISNEEIKKIELFNFHFTQEDSDDSYIEEALENMGEKFKKIIDNENVTFESNDINREFLNILKNNQYISNFKKQKENLIVIY